MPDKTPAAPPRTPVGVAFGAVLRDARKSKGASQEALALEIGYDRTYVSLLERGLRQPSLTTIIDLAERLDVPADLLVKRCMEKLRKKSV